MKFEKFHTGLAITEQPNGYYHVSALAMHGYSTGNEWVSYPNLTWVEVGTLMLTLIEEWSNKRDCNGAMPAADPWVQLSLLPEGLGQA